MELKLFVRLATIALILHQRQHPAQLSINTKIKLGKLHANLVKQVITAQQPHPLSAHLKMTRSTTIAQEVLSVLVRLLVLLEPTTMSMDLKLLPTAGLVHQDISVLQHLQLT